MGVGSDTKTAPPILALHCVDDDIKAFPFVVIPFIEQRNKIETDATSGLLWKTGKHQPFQHTDFYHEVAKFLADAAAYESPTTTWFHDVDYPGLGHRKRTREMEPRYHASRTAMESSRSRRETFGIIGILKLMNHV